MMEESILQFPKQFQYTPKIEQGNSIVRSLKKRKIIMVGMGGSHLAADLLSLVAPGLDMTVHTDYGLPHILPRDKKRAVLVASSYSGNTEEVIHAYGRAKKEKVPRIVITSGGKLLDLAKKDNVPFVRLPDTGIQPRMATGFSFMAFLALFGLRKELRDVQKLSTSLDVRAFKKKGYALANKLRGKVPLVYASHKNISLARNWKIKFNETAKIPSFYNEVPELNHNEMAGFSGKKSKLLGKNFFLVFLSDPRDSAKIKKRMKVTGKLMRSYGFESAHVQLQGRDIFSLIFSSLVYADWTALKLARTYGHEPEEVRVVEKFKHILSQ